MNRQIIPIICSRDTDSFENISITSQQTQLQKYNITLTTYGIQEQELQILYGQIQELGFTPISPHRILQSIAWLIHKEHINIPTGKEQTRYKVIDKILSRMRFEKSSKNQLHVIVTTNDGIQKDILTESKRFMQLADNKMSYLSKDPTVLGKVLQHIKNYEKEQTLLAIVGNNIGQIPVNGPRFILHQKTTVNCHKIRRKADKIINVQNCNNVRFEILREIVRQEQIEIRRQKLKKLINKGEIKMLPKFRIDNWPTDEVMSNLKRQVSTAVNKYIQEHNLLCDQQDLKYQTLFRLTTYNIEEVFIKGNDLNNYLKHCNVSGDWRNILHLDRHYVHQFTVKSEILETTIREQYEIIRDRLQNSKLPINKILNKTGIFAESGWVIQKKAGNIYAIQKKGAIKNNILIPIEFREIDPDLARQYHQDLHYIHTPRVDIAFGLFLKDESLPFSILSLEKVDRIYKENVLLMQGFDPQYCYDLTRLYSRPGTPGNTSSSIFSLTFSHIKNHYPQTQAILSAFMPSYANGMSMTSGGFENPVLIKPLIHTLEERLINGISAWEHITKRRQQNCDRKRIINKFSLLPTIELMAVLQKPRYTPIPEINNNMVELVVD